MLFTAGNGDQVMHPETYLRGHHMHYFAYITRSLAFTGKRG